MLYPFTVGHWKQYVHVFEGVWGAFIQNIFHFNHQKSSSVYVDSFRSLQIEASHLVERL